MCVSVCVGRSKVVCHPPTHFQVREHPVMLGECLGGALYIEDFRRICAKVGWLDVRELTREVRDYRTTFVWMIEGTSPERGLL